MDLNENLRWFAVSDALELALPSTMKTLLRQNRTRRRRGARAAVGVVGDGLSEVALSDALELALPSTMKTLLRQIERDGGAAPAQQLELWATD